MDQISLMLFCFSHIHYNTKSDPGLICLFFDNICNTALTKIIDLVFEFLSDANNIRRSY